ncbi:MAG TPA: aldehyde dehydrogenase family protein, partial [Burkholderiales bacterium]
MNKPLNQAAVLEELHHFIAGKEVAGRSGRSGEVFNPALGIIKARVPFASEAEVAAAVDAAQQALPGWASTPPLRRARVMFRFKELLDQHATQLAEIITREHGKVLSDAKGEVTRGIE